MIMRKINENFYSLISNLISLSVFGYCKFLYGPFVILKCASSIRRAHIENQLFQNSDSNLKKPVTIRP